MQKIIPGVTTLQRIASKHFYNLENLIKSSVTSNVLINVEKYLCRVILAFAFRFQEIKKNLTIMVSSFYPLILGSFISNWGQNPKWFLALNH